MILFENRKSIYCIKNLLKFHQKHFFEDFQKIIHCEFKVGAISTEYNFT